MTLRFEAERRPFHLNWHHGYIAELVEAIRLCQLRRTIINIPPRFLKSETFSQSMQAWFLGHDPGPASSVISVSYSAQLAEKDARITREIVESNWYHAIFPETLIKPDKRTANNWETTANGGRFATGVGGTLTGMGGQHIVVDDPLKPIDANSAIVRESTNVWLGETMRSRLNDQKTGTITVIMQRLHELDPTGYLLEKMAEEGADQYELICLPNESHEPQTYSYGNFTHDRPAGELLHEERIGAEETAALKVLMGANYEGQYNQRPVKMEGDFFQTKWVNFVKQSPKELRRTVVTHVYQAWDFAVSTKDVEKSDPDYSVCSTIGLDAAGRYILIDVWRGRVDTAALIDKMIDLHIKWRPGIVWGEQGVIEKAIRPWLSRRMQERGHTFYLDGVKPGKMDKIHRAQAFRGIVASGSFFMPKDAPWVPDVLSEMAGFPRGRHDDIIDTLAYLGMKVPSIRASRAADTPVSTGDAPTKVTGESLKRLIDHHMAQMAPKKSTLHF